MLECNEIQSWEFSGGRQENGLEVAMRSTKDTYSNFRPVIPGSPPKNPKARAFNCNNKVKQMLREETEVSGDFADKS